MVNASEQYRTQKAIRFARHGRSKITEKDGNAGAETRRENPQVIDGQSGDSRARGGEEREETRQESPGPTVTQQKNSKMTAGRSVRQEERWIAPSAQT